MLPINNTIPQHNSQWPQTQLHHDTNTPREDLDSLSKRHTRQQCLTQSQQFRENTGMATNALSISYVNTSSVVVIDSIADSRSYIPATAKQIPEVMAQCFTRHGVRRLLPINNNRPQPQLHHDTNIPRELAQTVTNDLQGGSASRRVSSSEKTSHTFASPCCHLLTWWCQVLNTAMLHTSPLAGVYLQYHSVHYRLQLYTKSTYAQPTRSDTAQRSTTQHNNTT